ncbi:hypothetical protein MKW98_022000 [Papaver atlanticum]|uniref:Uncharacterized protein n=1 Tax=Papaver atlanticum TaxID=357466 RepID=A0AAD4SHX1_9MAGN|nr:hypothetical protein MKW98_022000 [Papaver atlanticum]
MRLLKRSNKRKTFHRVGDDGGDDIDLEEKEYVINGESSTASLTVWRKSQVFNCNGFTVIDSSGDIVYRVDNYIGEGSKEIILMDGLGKAVFTICRQTKLGMFANWHVFEGDIHNDSTESSKRCNDLLKIANIPSALAQVVLYQSGRKSCVYTIEGSYKNRSCRILDKTKEVAAEISRKEAKMQGISFGEEVFLLIVRSGFDHGIAMTMIILLDQMFS